MKTENRIRWQLARIAASVIVVLAATQAAVAQFGHSDIDFALDGDKLITDKRVYESFFPTFGISKQFSANPGFTAESDGLGTIGSRREVVYDVLDHLILWDGIQFVSPDDEVRIRIDNNPPGSSSTYIDAKSGKQIGSSDPPVNRIGASSAGGEVHSHVNFFLEAGDDDPPFGAYGLKLAISIDREEVIDSDPVFVVFNFGLEASLFEESLAAYEGLLEKPGVAGDFDSSGALDVGDIDLLTDAVLRNSTGPNFDLNADGKVDQDDRRDWVEVLRATYFGDSDLDGEFNSSDFVAVFQRGEYEDDIADNSTWAEGDWNGDREFDSADFVLAFQSGGYEKGPGRVVAVPEPHAALPLATALTTMLVWFRTTRKLRDARSVSATILTDAQTSLT